MLARPRGSLTGSSWRRSSALAALVVTLSVGGAACTPVGQLRLPSAATTTTPAPTSTSAPTTTPAPTSTSAPTTTPAPVSPSPSPTAGGGPSTTTPAATPPATSGANPPPASGDRFPARFDGLVPTNGGRHIWVSPTGDDGRTGTSADQAVRTPQRAVDLARCGDTILLGEGTYTSDRSTIIPLEQECSAGRELTVAAAPGARPVLKTNAKTWNAVNVLGDHIIVQGLTIDGHRDELTLEGALANKNVTNNPRYNSNGISVGTRTVHPHHVTVRQNNIFDVPGGGISAIESDYITVEDNRVTGTSHFGVFGQSGISFLGGSNSDRSTDTKMIIRRNVLDDNRMFVPWEEVGRITDGNGIICDSNKEQNTRGRTLIENNVVSNSGGRGVNVFECQNVDVLHNTTFNNSLSPEIRDDEISVNSSVNVLVNGNVAVGRAGGTAISAGTTAQQQTDRIVIGKNQTDGDLRFVDPGGLDFRLRAGSPAIDASDGTRVPRTDVRGVPRPAGRQADLGAYES